MRKHGFGIFITFVLIGLIVLVGVTGHAIARPKTDVVVLKNGDRVTCEIKELSKGKLKVKTDSMGTIEIEWKDIVALRSEFYFRVENADGERFFGALELREGEKLLRIVSESRTTSLPVLKVVEITEIEKSFWERLDGSLSIGFSFTKASDVAQLTVDWTNLYKTERNLVDLKAKSIVTDKGTEEDTKRRVDFAITYYRLLRQRWSGSINTAVQRNDELDLERRVIVSIGAGSSPIKSNRNVLLLSAGVALNSELATGATKTNESAEGVIVASYSLFQYDTPKTDISTSLNFYPSITERDRYRLDFDIKFRREMIKDLFFDLSYNFNYDSKAPSGEGEKRDYGIVTSVGWSY